MSSIISAQPAISEDVDQALTTLINLHLRSNGLSLDSAKIAQIKQEEAVLQFLHSVVDLGRRKLAHNGQPESMLPQPAQGKPSHPVDPAAKDTAASAAAPAHKIVFWVPPKLSPTEAQAAPVNSTLPPAAAAPATPPAQIVPAPLQQKTVEPTKATVPIGPAPAFTMPPPKPLPKLRLPNATAEIIFSYTFDLARASLGDYKLIDIAGLEGSGLSFNAADQMLHGTPSPEPGKSHEYTFTAKLQNLAGASTDLRTMEIGLFVNPHPRTLWKEVEPDATLPFQKPHRRSMDVRNETLRAVAASVRGRSHAQSGSFREDDFHIKHDASGEWTVIAVSDGAGSAKMSRRGSQLATEISVEQLAGALQAINAELAAALPEDKASELSQSTQGLESIRHMLFDPVGRAAFQASKAIQAEAVTLQVEEKALSATLLLAAMRKWGNGFLVASYWIGDGAAAIFDQKTGTLHLLGDADAGEYSGQTRFLLSSEFGAQAWESIKKRFRCRWVPQGSCLVLMSDGVSDPKFGTDNALRDPDRWVSWWRGDLASAVNLSRDNAALPKDLETYLEFWSQGEHDDRTLALVY